MNVNDSVAPPLLQPEFESGFDELQYYRNLFDHAPYGSLLLDASEQIQMANLTLAQMLKIDRAELLARPLSDFIDPADLADFRRHVEAVRRIAAPQRAYFTLCWQDRRVPVLVESRLETGSRTSIQMALTDIRWEQDYVAQLSESEARYRLLFENAADFIFVHEMTDGETPGPFLEVNNATCRRLGYTHEELMQLNPSEIVHGRELPDLSHQHVALLENGVLLFEQVLVAKDGVEIPVEIHSHMVEWRGRPMILTIARDISRRRNAEREAKRIQADYETIFNSAQDALFLIKVEGPGRFRYIRTNTYHQQKTGVPLEQIQYKTPQELLGEELGWRLAQNYQCCVDAAAPITYEEELTLSGTERVWLTTLTPVTEEGQITHLVGSAIDITERLRAERALRESETRFRELFEYSSVAYQSLDAEGHFVDANAELCALLGYEWHELQGRSFGYFWHPDIQSRFPDRFANFIANGAVQSELKLRHKNGEPITVLLSGRIQHDGAGNFLRTHCVLYNITEHKRAEAQAFALALEQERLRLLTHFIQSASHEFLTPLSVIRANAHLLLRSENVERRGRYHRQIAEQITLLTKLVEMLLEIVKLESDGRMKVDAIDTVAFLRSICEIFAVRVGAPQFFCQIAEDLPPIRGDESYLRRAISHILENACRFTPADGAIVMKSTLRGQGVEIAIKDSGPGIDAEALPHIFDTFWRQDNAHTTPGLGLGLSMTQKIIQMHGGRIEVESEAGQGALFRIVLPSLQ